MQRQIIPGLNVDQTLSVLDKCLIRNQREGGTFFEADCLPRPDTLPKLYEMVFNSTWRNISRMLAVDASPQGLNRIYMQSQRPGFPSGVVPQLRQVEAFAKNRQDQYLTDEEAEEFDKWQAVTTQVASKVPYITETIIASIRYSQKLSREQREARARPECRVVRGPGCY